MGWTGYAQLRGDLLWYAVGVSLVLVVVLVLQISSACARSSKGRWGWVAVTSTPSFERRLRKQRPASIVVAPSTKNSMMVVNPVVAARWQQAGAAARGPGAAGRPVRIDLVASRVMDELPTTTTPPPTTTTSSLRQDAELPEEDASVLSSTQVPRRARHSAIPSEEIDLVLRRSDNGSGGKEPFGLSLVDRGWGVFIVRVRPGGATSRAFARVVDEWSLDEGWRVLAVDGSPVDSENGLAHASVARRMQRADGDVILRLRRDPKGYGLTVQHSPDARGTRRS